MFSDVVLWIFNGGLSSTKREKSHDIVCGEQKQIQKQGKGTGSKGRAQEALYMGGYWDFVFDERADDGIRRQ